MRHRLFVILLILLLPALAVAGGRKDNTPDENASAEPGTATESAGTGDESAQPSSGSPLDASDPDRFIATVNGVGILRSDFDLTLQRTQLGYAQQGITLAPGDLEVLRQDVLDQLIARELLYQEALSQGIEASTQTASLQFEQLRGQFQTEEAWNQALAAEGLDEGELRDQIERQLVIQEIVGNVVADVEEVTQDDIQNFYDENPQFFDTGDQLAARHILISTEGLDEAGKADALARAEAIRDELIAGADFAATAIEKSEGPSGPRGGDLPTFGRGEMVGAFEQAAFALEVDEISEVVETQFGYHIIQVTERIPGTVTPIEDVSANIENFLAQENEALVLQEYVGGLREAATVVVNE
jgi:peptidyl-prolyl cis-trans isomerase C